MNKRDAFKLAKSAWSGIKKNPARMSSVVAMGEVVLIDAENNTIVTLYAEADISRVKTACMIAEQRIEERKCKRFA